MRDRTSLLDSASSISLCGEDQPSLRLLFKAVALILLALAAVRPLRAATGSLARAAAVDEGSAATGTASDKQAGDHAARPIPPASHAAGTRFGVAFTSSTLGLGPSFIFRAIPAVNLRVGFSTFRYASDQSQDGVDYHGVLHLKSMNVLADWYPTSGGFHVSAGLLFYNANRVTARGAPPTGTVFTAGQEAFISDPQNPIVGDAKSKVRNVAPMLLVGFGNLLPRGHHFAYSIDVGLVYQGSPKSSFNLTGGACDPSGQFCGGVAGDANIQAEAQSATSDLDHGVRFMRYYPVLSIGFGYHF